MRLPRHSAGTVIAALLAVFFLSFATQAYPQTAKLAGSVFTRNAGGEELNIAEAHVELTCDSSLAKVWTATANAEGRFLLEGVPEGVCTLRATAAGFGLSSQQITIMAGTNEARIELALASVNQRVEVTAEAPTVDTKATTPQEGISGQVLEHAPLPQEQLVDAIPLIPGAVRGPDGLLNIKGAQANQTGVLLNSADANDPVTGDLRLALPIDVVQSVEVLANPYDAEYGKVAGAVTSIQTKQGGEKFRFTIQNFLLRPRFREDSIRGVEAATPRLTLSGPLVKGKIYWVQSFEYRYVRTRVPGLRHLDSQLKSDTDLEGWESHSQMDWEKSANHHLSFSLSVFPQKLRYLNLNTFNPQETTPNLHQRGFMVSGQDRLIFRNQSFLESFFSIKDNDSDLVPSTQASLFVLAPAQNLGSYFNSQRLEGRRYELRQLYHFRPFGHKQEHLLKAGWDLNQINFHGYNQNHSVDLLRGDGSLAERIDFRGNGWEERSGTELSWFLQDTWTPLSRITLSPGVRLDRDTLAGRWNPAFRFGFSIALTGDNRTVLRGGAGLFYDKIPLNVKAFPQLQERTETYYALDGSTFLGQPISFLNRLGRDLQNPHSWAWNAELDRELRHNLLFRLSYQQRQTSREFIVNPIMGAVPEILVSNNGSSLYREFAAEVKYKFSGGQVVASYVRSHSFGDLNHFNDFFGTVETPLLRPNQRSLQAFDVPNRVLIWGDLNLPHDIIVSPVLDWRDGFPYSLLDADWQYVGVRNLAGRFPRFLSLDLQATKGFSLPLGRHRLKGRAGIRLFNITDHFNPRDLQNNLSAEPVTFREECSQYGQFCNSVGRIIRGKLSLNF